MKYLFVIILALLIFACDEEVNNPYHLKLLSVSDIRQEYIVADSLNRVEDILTLPCQTDTLGVDIRNSKIVGRVCGTRAFGCLLYTHYYTVLYLDCDSAKCEKNGGINITDYAGIGGTPVYVGCAPDTAR